MIVDHLEPERVAADLSIGIAVSTFNQAITDRLLAGCLAELEVLAVGAVQVARVPGALELPLAADILARRGCDGVVAVGAVVKGETDHYDVIVRESSSGLMRVCLDHQIPVGNAVLALTDAGHGVERSEPGPSNKGAEAARAVVETALTLGRP
jgi:6,7-dimethyl-8-ribityllumazine synthase